MSEIGRANHSEVVPFDFCCDYFWWTRFEVDGNARDLTEYRKALLRDPCAYCGAASTVLDHVEARCRGGSDEWWNLVGLCTPCNAAKHSRSVLGFLGGNSHRPVLEAVKVVSSTWAKL